MANLSEHIEQRFTVDGIPSVTVSNIHGDVRVAAGTTGQVALDIRKHVTAASDDEAQRILDNIVVEIAQEGDMIHLETRTRQRDPFGNFFMTSERWHIDIALTVPPTTNLRLALNAGDATIRDITGALEVHLNSGDLAASDLHITERGEWHLNSGDAVLERVTVAAPAHFVMNSGDVTLHEVIFDAHVAMKTNSGDIRGEVTLGEGAHMQLRLNAGNVRLELPATTAAHLDATVTAGSVHINGFPVAITRHYAQARATGDLAPHPTRTITCRMNAGNLALAAR
jgi:DUF4097 and DUF4098 domain-containing protein YvlB